MMILRFQYPPSDRTRCNLAKVTLDAAPVELSVSSIGSNPL